MASLSDIQRVKEHHQKNIIGIEACADKYYKMVFFAYENNKAYNSLKKNLTLHQFFQEDFHVKIDVKLIDDGAVGFCYSEMKDIRCFDIGMYWKLVQLVISSMVSLL